MVAPLLAEVLGYPLRPLWRCFGLRGCSWSFVRGLASFPLLPLGLWYCVGPCCVFAVFYPVVFLPCRALFWCFSSQFVGRFWVWTEWALCRRLWRSLVRGRLLVVGAGVVSGDDV